MSPVGWRSRHVAEWNRYLLAGPWVAAVLQSRPLDERDESALARLVVGRLGHRFERVLVDVTAVERCGGCSMLCARLGQLCLGLEHRQVERNLLTNAFDRLPGHDRSVQRFVAGEDQSLDWVFLLVRHDIAGESAVVGVGLYVHDELRSMVPRRRRRER